MISLFLKPPKSLTKNLTFSRMTNIRQRFNENLSKVKDWYVRARQPVPSNHPLVTFLNTVVVSTHSLSSFFDSAQMNGYATGSSLGFSSFAYNHSWQKKNWFYQDTVREYVFIKESDPAVSFTTRWQDIEAVVVNYHPRSDFSYLTLDASTMTDEAGYAVITIDAVALLYQYRKWWSETQLPLPPAERLSARHFVGMYVLPGMLRSHIDVAFINRIRCHLTGALPATPKKQAKMALASTITYLDDTCNEIISRLTAGNISFTDMVQVIPVPYQGKLSDITALSQEPPTVSTKTYRALRSIPYMELLAALDIMGNRRINEGNYSEWVAVLRRLRSENWLRDLGYMRQNLMERISENIEAYIP